MIEDYPQENWIAVSKSLGPVEGHTAMAAEVAGACLRAEILNHFIKKMNVEMVTRCIHIVTNEMTKKNTTMMCKH